MSGGVLHSCGVQGDGTLWCWGANDHGQVGDGTQTNRLAPVRVPGQAWGQVAAGNLHTCSRRQDGSLWCWGSNAYGEIGDGTQTQHSAPEQVVGQLCSQVPVCGNSQIEPGEECDDGNNDSGDGCTMDCRIEKCFGVVCTALDQCHDVGICDPGSGTCPNTAKPDGASCEDGNLCTLLDTCQAGTCNPGSPKQCVPLNECFAAGTCDPGTGICSDPPIDKVGCNINLRVDGVANMGGGKYVAIFGYESTARTSFHPTTNTVSIDEVLQPSPTPHPPAYLLPGPHLGAFLPSCSADQTISWAVDGQPIDVTCSPQTALTPEPVGTGSQVELPDGTIVIITPDLSPYEKTPDAPGVPEDLPTGDDFKGTIPGQLTVGPTGAAIYTVPISIPPGIAGMAPNLSLVYNSQGGDGIAGQGWELTGLSMIYRCPKTKVQDGYAQPVSMNGTSVADADGDGVCLDGKRLFPLAFGGVHTGLFKAETEDFSQITLDAAGEVFTVVTKSGETRYYGYHPGARVRLCREDANGPTPGGDLVIALWALDRVEDPWGNYYEIEYNDGTDIGNGNVDFYLRGLIATKIDYTGNPGDSTHGATPTFNSITFDYEPRNDTSQITFRSSAVRKNQRLKGISTPRGRYSLTYWTSDTWEAKGANSLLGSISYCTTDDTPACLKDLTFDWGARADVLAWQPAPDYRLPIDRWAPGMQFVDLNADGRLDLVSAAKNRPYHVYYNNGKGWEPRDDWNLPTDAALANWDVHPPALGTIFADIDGDGLPDLITDKAGTTSKPAVWLNRTRDPNAATPWERQTGDLSGDKIASLLSAHNLPPLDLTAGHYQLVDIDNDGRPEIVENQPLMDVCLNYDYHVYPFVVSVLSFQNQDGARQWTLTSHGDNPEDWLNYYHPERPMGNIGYSFAAILEDDYSMVDLNRDGLPDVVGRAWLAFNTGHLGAGDHRTMWNADPVRGPPCVIGSARPTVDVNGDGVYDSVVEATKLNGNGKIVPDPPIGSSSAISILYGTGLCWTYQMIGTNYYRYTTALDLFSWWPEGGIDPYIGELAAGRYKFADLNADGRIDVVVGHNSGGVLLLNTGETWRDAEGRDSRIPPNPGPRTYVVPTAVSPIDLYSNPDSNFMYNVDEFIDVDGDGVTDRVQVLDEEAPPELYQTVKGSWLNTYSPPTIRHFPNGFAKATEVTYAVTTTADAQRKGIYSDLADRAPGTMYMAVPLRVVESVAADNGVDDERAKTTYKYRDLRASAFGRGPQGFRQVAMTDPTGMVTTTTYAQAYPYTGMPTTVTREQKVMLDDTKWEYCDRPAPAGEPTECIEQMVLVAKTETEYCDNPAAAGDLTKCTPITGVGSGIPKASVFVYPLKVTDTSFLRGSNMAPLGSDDETITTTTEYVYDLHGNPAITTVTTESSGSGGKFKKEVANDYGAEESTERKRGKVKRTVVTTRRLAPDGDADDATTIHTTEFEYETDSTLALKKKKVEPGKELGIQLHTAYEYDRFGNLVTTTNCASDFGDCKAGEDNPVADPQDPNHPSFRTTRVSYDPIDFQPGETAPDRSLSYGDGRFPVKTTNAEGHVQYSAYSPLLGVLIQSTGPNGIHTCYDYDALGYQRSETARCVRDSEHPLKTTIDRYLVSSSTKDPPLLAKTLVLTQPPTGAASGVYADALGRTIATLARSFDGKLTYTMTEYDGVGRVAGTCKPFFRNAAKYWTTPSYDWLGRVSTVTQQLGPIDDTAKNGTSVVTTTYWGSVIQTHQTVKDEVRDRYETKNVLGKVAKVKDAAGKEVSYFYDADGSLTKTATDEVGNSVLITYDLLGRKHNTTDPDLGTWTYGYNGFGDLISQTDAKNQTTTMTYDRLGRMSTKTDPTGGTAEWVYDKGPGGRGKLTAMIGAPDSRLNGSCSVPETTQTSGKRAGRWFTYTPWGDVDEANECTDGETFSTKYQYDGLGRQSVVTYPQIGEAPGSRFATKYHYTNLGFLHYVADASDDKPYWVAKAMNAAGQVTEEYTRNGVKTIATRNASTGWLRGSSVTAQADANTLIQGLTFAYDEVGNLRGRTRSMPSEMADSTETFGYDQLDRLITAQVKIPSTAYDVTEETYAYDGIGNLTEKGGKTYTYAGCGAGPHAVCTVGGGAPFEYDANGNMTSGNGRTVAYNPANKPVHIGNDTGTVDFIYGADGHRVMQSVGTNGSESARTVYVGLGGTGKSIYERTTHVTTGEKEHVHFIYAGGAHGGNAFALRVVTEGGPGEQPPAAMKYNHFDHLGSVTAMSDETGRVLGPTWGGADATVFGYDAWGARRNPDGSSASPSSFNLQVGHREFTSHETIPNVGLVNMNGRVYDPELGRFLTPDPNVQFVADLQSYNRYSYVLNNPLRYTDPTGYAWYSFLGSGEFWFNVAWGLGGAAICASGGAPACMMVAMMSTLYTSTAMISQGASFGQVVKADLVGFAAGYLGGTIGGRIAGALGSNPAFQVLGGAIAGAAAAGMSTPLLGGSLGKNLLLGATSGALAAAVAWSVQSSNPVSQSAVGESQGGGGSGADKVEKTETVDSILAEGGYGGAGPSDEEVMALAAGPDWHDKVRFMMGSNNTGAFIGDPLSVDDVVDVMAALDNVGNTQSGGAMLRELTSGSDPLLLSKVPGNLTEGFGREIFLDPKEQLCVHTDNPRGWDPNVLEAQLAHEGGHFLGGEDNGFGGMNNTNQYENPVRMELMLYRRTQMGFATCGGP